MKRWNIRGLVRAGLLVVLAFCAMPSVKAVDVEQQSAPDNTRANRGDSKPNSDSQNSNATDEMITKQIRAAIVKDKTLSTYAHNIKIISQDGKVTLKGPVRSDDEKSNIDAKAQAVAGSASVMNQLTVAPPKK